MITWYSWRDIVYNREQVEWIWENYALISSGKWPPECRESGYIGNPSSRSVSTEGNFVKPAIVAAEISMRCERCWPDCDLVEDKYLLGLTERQIATKRHLTEEEVARRINKVLWYSASGRNQRKETYAEWKKNVHGNRKYASSGSKTP